MDMYISQSLSLIRRNNPTGTIATLVISDWSKEMTETSSVEREDVLLHLSQKVEPSECSSDR